jgi:hypothetical protein
LCAGAAAANATALVRVIGTHFGDSIDRASQVCPCFPSICLVASLLSLQCACWFSVCAWQAAESTALVNTARAELAAQGGNVVFLGELHFAFTRQSGLTGLLASGQAI